MTRIVAGSARGRRLQVPTTGTRPTSDRTREGLFNTLGSIAELDGAIVADLYAGSGAVGLEALSRGAAQVILVEQAPAAIGVLSANVEAVGLPGARVVRSSVASYLRGKPARGFDVVFADPPYDLPSDGIDAVVQGLLEPGWLAPEAIVVIERSTRSPAVNWPEPLNAVKEKRYGESVLWYGQLR